mgnify:CR=1 FL=1
MVRYDDSVDSVLHRQARILAAVQALDQKFHLGQLAQLIERLPVGTRRIKVRWQSLVHRSLRRRDVTGIAIARVHSSKTLSRLRVSPRQQIHRPGHGGAARGFHTPHQLLGGIPVDAGLEEVLRPGRQVERVEADELRAVEVARQVFHAQEVMTRGILGEQAFEGVAQAVVAEPLRGLVAEQGLVQAVDGRDPDPLAVAAGAAAAGLNCDRTSLRSRSR